MRPVNFSITPVAADNAGISTSQTPSGAGDLTITGALATGGVATLAPNGNWGRQVLITCAGADAGKNFTIYGTIPGGGDYVYSEVVAGSNASTSTSVGPFLTVTRVAVSAALAGAVIVGTNGVVYSAPVVHDVYLTPFNVSVQADIGGTINYTLQYTLQDMLSSSGAAQAALWNSNATMVTKTVDFDVTITSPITASRVKINSFTASTATIAVNFVQAGVR